MRHRRLIVATAAVLLLPALGSAALAQNPAKDVHRRYRNLMETCAQELKAAEGRYRAQLVGKYWHDGKLADEGTALFELRRRQEDVRGAIRELDALLDSWEKRKINLGRFLRDAMWQMTAALGAAWRAQIDEMLKNVLVTRHTNHREYRDLIRQYADERDRYEETLRSQNPEMEEEEIKAKCRAHSAKLKSKSAQAERPLVSAHQSRYRELTRWILSRRRFWCGEAWKLQDFHERRGQEESATHFLRVVYGHFGRELRLRGEAFLSGLYGKEELKFLDAGRTICDSLTRPPAPSAVYLKSGFSGNPGRLGLEEALDAEPVERLRQYDTGVPSLKTEGTNLEQMCQLLSGRLVRFHTLRKKQRGLLEEFRKRTERAGETKNPPDVEPLLKDLADFSPDVEDFLEHRAEREAAAKELKEKEAALGEAEKELEDAEKGVHLSQRLRRCDPDKRGARPAAEWLRVKEQSLEAARKVLEDPGTSDDQKKKIRKVTIPRLEDEIRDIRAATARGTSAERRAVERARSLCDKAREALAKLPERKEEELHQRFEAVRRTFGEVASALPEHRRKGLPEMGGKLEDWTMMKTGPLARALVAAVEGVRLDQRNRRLEAEQVLGGLGRVDAEMRYLGGSVTNLRAAGILLAQTVLEELGADQEDEVLRELRKAHEGLREFKDAFDSADKRLGRLEYVRFMLHHGNEGKALIEGVKDRLELFSEALGKVEEWADRVVRVQELAKKLDDPRTAVGALEDFFALADPLVKAVPVQGEMMSSFLGFYGQAAVACGKAAVAIQDTLIEQNIGMLFDQPAPERHLYTLREVTANSSLENDEANKRIARMLQVRRLISLCHAKTLAEAMDKR